MSETVIASRSGRVSIGPGLPLVIIGERINPTGRRALAAELQAGDLSRVERDAIAQVEAGAQMLDVNVGVVDADEPTLMAEAVRLVQSVVDVPLSIDSSVPSALEAGLSAYEGKALVNSTTGEEDRMRRILPVVARHRAAVVAIAHDEAGISDDPEVRFQVARKIVGRAAEYGIRPEDILVDPLVLPIGAKPESGRAVLALLPRLRDELGVNTVCGASNVSFGLPHREGLNSAFIIMLIAAGLSAAITNPLNAELKRAILAAETLLGRDEYCMEWIKAHRTTSSSTPS